MEFITKMYKDVCVLSPRGNLRGEPETTDLQILICDTVKKKTGKVLLDLGGVNWMGSTGLGIITSCMIKAREKGGDVRLCRPNRKVQRLINISKLRGIFRIYDHIGEALDNYKNETAVPLKSTALRTEKKL